MYQNSLSKIVETYFRTFALDSFEYNGSEVAPPPTTVISPFLWRGYTCPASCGGCCKNFSLVYLPEEKFPYEMSAVTYSFNGRPIKFYEDRQDGNETKWCKNLRHDDGRCGIHGSHPFSCDFELIRIIAQENKSWVGTRLYGRGWSYKRVDGQQGAMCEITEITEPSRLDVLRKLGRLKVWMDYCGIANSLQMVIDHGSSNDYMTPLSIKNSRGVALV